MFVSLTDDTFTSISTHTKVRGLSNHLWQYRVTDALVPSSYDQEGLPRILAVSCHVVKVGGINDCNGITLAG